MAINDERDKALAQVLVRHSIKAKKGELVFINAIGEDTLGLAEAVSIEVLKVGAAPYLQFIDPEIERRFLHGASKEALEARKKLELGQIKASACYVGIRGSRNIFEYSDVPPRQMDLYNKTLGHPVRDERVRNTRWVVLRYPNSSMAQLSMTPREKFADFYYNVCTLDYAAMERAMRPLKTLMEKTDKVEIKGPGTDIRFSIKGISAVPCSGEHNIPDGECFTAPVKNSIEGRVSFTAPTVYEGSPFDKVVLDFEKGKVVNATAADKEQTKKLNAILDQDPGARYIGEFSLAFNPHILHPMRDILFDEKIAGSFHMALGAAYGEADNGNRSAVHWDMVCIQRKDYGGGEIHFDGKLLRKDGLFVPKSLQGLNPAAFTKKKR